MAHVKKFMKDAHIHQWGKVQHVDSEAGDTICAALLGTRSEDSCDATFVQVKYEMYMDKNAQQQCKKPDLVLQTFYGQLQHIFVVQFDSLEAHTTLKLEPQSRYYDFCSNPGMTCEGSGAEYIDRSGSLACALAQPSEAEANQEQDNEEDQNVYTL
ncbi:hypothetical protein C0995_002096 [Termitomyces sp. Mi166|nr:hypothetical protein C0995_002096 [Termitomyces sp. Mi166\